MKQDQGSLQKAVSGEYHFTVGEILSESWERVSGSKLKILGGFFIYVIISALISKIFTLVLDAKPYYTAAGVYEENIEFYNSLSFYIGLSIDTLSSWLIAPVVVPLSLGVLLLGYQRANNEELRVENIFNYYIYVWPLVFTSILVVIFTYIGTLLFILPGIYLSIAYTFALPLIVDKKLGVWAAMEVSRQAVTQHWFMVFSVLLVLGLLTMLSAIPMGIGLIWTLPLFMIAHGVMYRKIFGWNIHDPIAE